MSSSKRYSKREVSRLLGMARDGIACSSVLARVVRQLRRELATRQEPAAALNDEIKRQALVIERLKRDLAEAQNATILQPIATAPKDGTYILAYWNEKTYSHEFGTRFDVVQFLCDSWCATNGECDLLAPTHWMPLPPPRM